MTLLAQKTKSWQLYNQMDTKFMTLFPRVVNVNEAVFTYNDVDSTYNGSQWRLFQVQWTSINLIPHKININNTEYTYNIHQ